jgi:carboxyl-terminal processing protease
VDPDPEATVVPVSRHTVPLVAVSATLFGLIVGIWWGGHPKELPTFIRDALVDDSNARVYEEALDVIDADFYRRVDRDALLNASLAGAIERLKDPFSHYFNPDEYAKFQQSTSGEFEGVGMLVVDHPKGLEIQRVFDGGPAKEAGLERGDVIVAVDGTKLEGKNSDAATALIKGKAGTTVRLTIASDGRERVETMRREAVAVPVVDSRAETRDGKKVAWIALSAFTSGAHGELRTAVQKRLKEGAKGIVLDLRDNGGGLLEEGVLVSSIFIADGTIVTTKGRTRPTRGFEASGSAIADDVEMVVLVNRGTASASEIVAGALQDRARAVVVGTRTFGKGVFQQVEELSNGGALDITVGEYFTPKGRNLGPRNGKPGGITPEVRAQDDPDTPKRDEALDTAFETLVANL